MSENINETTRHVKFRNFKCLVVSFIYMPNHKIHNFFTFYMLCLFKLSKPNASCSQIHSI